jgi:hypothetical protein
MEIRIGEKLAWLRSRSGPAKKPETTRRGAGRDDPASV